MTNPRPIDIERARRERTPQPAGNELFRALARARGEFPEIERKRTARVRLKTGDSYSYTYADLSDVFAAINPVLSAYGLNIFQWPEGETLYTEITHESGLSKIAEWPIKAMPARSLQDAQSYQSAVQVAKRYALTALLGIATEETVEGDPKTHRPEQGSAPVNTINDQFETADGRRMPKGANITGDMTPRQMAEEAARAIEAQFNEVKTAVGLNGVWNRNQMFIDKLAEKHSDLFDEIHDAFHSLLAQFEGDTE